MIDRRYRVEQQVGGGGFGRVYRCVEIATGKSVAVKVLRPDHLAGPCRERIVAKFREEAQILARLEHPNIVPVRDWGQTAEIPVYIVMDYIEGMSLAQRLREQWTPVSHEDAVRWIIEVAKALVYAHGKGVFHLDIKPANILFQGDIQVKGPQRILLADFGLALRDDQRLQRGRDTSGTPAYMSPEQVRGEIDRIDAWTNVYGLGATLYAMLAGRPPFKAARTAKSSRKWKMSMTPQSLRSLDPNIPEELERICSKALSKQPSDRYARRRTCSTNSASSSAPASNCQPPPGPGGGPGGEPGKIVPKGLQPFDKDDADFFLRLVPGALDRARDSRDHPPLEVEDRSGGSRRAAGGGPDLRPQRLRQVVAGPRRAAAPAGQAAGAFRLRPGDGRPTERTLREPAARQIPGPDRPAWTWSKRSAPWRGTGGGGGRQDADRPGPIRAMAGGPPPDADAELLDALRLCSQCAGAMPAAGPQRVPDGRQAVHADSGHPAERAPKLVAWSDRSRPNTP